MTQTHREMSEKTMKYIFFDTDHLGRVVVGISIHMLGNYNQLAMVDTY